MESEFSSQRSGGKRRMMEEQYHEDAAYDSPPFKRCRKGEGPSIELRVLLKSSASGAIIGKSGQNIKRLRETFDATVAIPDCSGPERILTISADLGTCLEILRDSIPRTVEPSPGARGPQDVEVRLLVHQSQAGGVIGKSGQRIKEIREATNAQIKVFAQCCPLSSDRVVLISGKIEQVADTVQRVIEIANDAGIKGSSQPYDPFNFDEFNAVEYGGFGTGGGGGGSGGGRGGMGDGVTPAWGEGRDGGYGGTPMSRGGGRGGGGARGGGARGGGARGGGRGGRMLPSRGMPPSRGMGQRGMPQRGMADRGFDGPQFSGNDRGFNDAGFPGRRNTADSQGELESHQVSIPKDLAGSIIGPQGTRIRAIRAQSGAQIIIGEAEPETQERVITIDGTEEQIQNAQYLMQMAVRQHSGKF